MTSHPETSRPEPTRPGTHPDARSLWESMYAGSTSRWSGRPNAVLVDVVSGLAPGRSLDLGCGEGGDVVWLAQQGWEATGADVSATALERAAALAERAGVVVSLERHDLGPEFPAGAFDLVTASFLHSTDHLDVGLVLRRALAALAPGGSLVVLGHAEPPPWAGEEHRAHAHLLPTPEQVLALLEVPADVEVLRAGLVERGATGPDGQPATLRDSLVHVRRRG